MSEKDSSYYIAQMLLGIRYLHLKLKVIYRDLKPENCLLNSFGNLVLTDFGLSKIAADNEDGTTKNHSITGQYNIWHQKFYKVIHMILPLIIGH